MISFHFVPFMKRLGMDNPVDIFGFSYISQPTCPIIGNIGTPYPVFFQRATELRIEIYCIVCFSRSISPSSASRRTTHPSSYSPIIYPFYILPSRSSSHTAGEIDLNTGLFMFRISKPHNSAMRCSRQLRFYFIIGKKNRIVSGRSFFRSLVIT
ncbi:unknown [Tannerella sp. CAG:51]|nr:unknown [Tannerella sp. CAG:51]